MVFKISKQIRVVVSEDIEGDIEESVEFLNSVENEFVPWGYSTVKKINDCDYAMVYQKGNPDKTLNAILKVQDVVPRESPKLSRSNFPPEWDESYDYFKSFYLVDEILDCRDSPISMSDVRNLKEEEITQRGKLRSGIFVKYIGNSERVLNFIN